MPFHKLLGDPQANTGSQVSFRRKERLHDFLCDLLRDTMAAIANIDTQSFCVSNDLDLHLRRIRKAGHEKSASYLVKGVVNISFPVLNHQGSAIAALTQIRVPRNLLAASSRAAVLIVSP